MIMPIQKIEIKNFRLLNEVELSLEKRTTVIVGRNNSGKTSLTELFRRLPAIPNSKIKRSWEREKRMHRIT
jgi:putative ATP-dependent endonuclease of the OLD family